MNSEELLSWTIQTIRDDEGLGSWLEERKYDWIPLVENLLRKVLSEESQTVIIFTDSNYEWLGKYILSNVNSLKNERPFIPFVHLKSLYPNLDMIKTKYEEELLIDLLDITFKQNYTFWYIGKSDDPRAKIAKNSNNSFLWLVDEQIQNSFYLSSIDPILDLKLLQLVRLFFKTLDSTLYGEIHLS